MSRLAVVAILAGIGLPLASGASFTVDQIGPDTWTYDLTFDPLDNYSQLAGPTTITIDGLYGVTAAFAPTSTDLPQGWHLNWTAQVLNGGTTVVWTHDGTSGSGSGNFDDTRHIFGFSLTAPGTVNGLGQASSTGFTTDSPDFLDRNFSGPVAGPVAPDSSGVPEPSTWGMVLAGLGAAALRRFRSRQNAR